MSTAARFVASVRNAIFVPLAEIDASNELPFALTPAALAGRANVAGVPLKSWTIDVRCR